jgi:hypothetical protein
MQSIGLKLTPLSRLTSGKEFATIAQTILAVKMAQALQANDLTLSEVEDLLNLRQVLNEPAFFPEWQAPLPKLNDPETQALDRVKTEFLYLTKYPMLEDLVKMLVLSPLLSLAGFYRPPIRPVLEKRVDVSIREGEKTVWGRVDILGLQQQIWVAVIESKQAGFSLKDAIAQALFYMMANPSTEKPAFGLVTNGSHFIFIKLVRGEISQYSFSTEFSLFRPENELYEVLKILKRFAELAIAP